MATTSQHDVIERYAQVGFVIVPRAVAQPDVERLRAEADRLAEDLVDQSLALGRPSPRLDAHERGGTVTLRKIQPLADVSPEFAAAAERLGRDLAAPLLGDEPVLMEEKLNYKQVLPGAPAVATGDEDDSFPFHTDIAYFWLDGYPHATLTVGLALDPATADNGCLRVVPGSHLQQWPVQEGWPPILPAGTVADADAVDVVLDPGDAVAFSSCLVHASAPNASGAPRRMALLSYAPATAVAEVEPDRRNRHLRAAGQEFEREYRAAVDAGRWTPGYRLR